MVQKLTLPANAGDMGLIPGQGTEPRHDSGQLSPMIGNYWTHAPQQESLRAATKTQGSKIIFFFGKERNILKGKEEIPLSVLHVCLF